MIYIEKFCEDNGIPKSKEFNKTIFNKMKELWDMNDFQLAHFLGQCHVESMGFKVVVENLNYSEQGLLSVFRKYFNTDTAKQYARKPEQIANIVYANRMGNGSEKSGEGWKFRGRGIKQLTGKNNYKLFKIFIKDDVVKNPELVSEKYYFDSAVWYFNSNNIKQICINSIDESTIKQVTRKVNGGLNGIDERIKWTKHYYYLIR
jgi:putative chitinase